MKNRRFFPMVPAMIAAIAFAWTASSAAGTWSGSTPDNGMGQSVSVQGSSTEVPDPNGAIPPDPCLIHYSSTTTITVTDNATGKVVSKTTRTRQRRYRKKDCPKKCDPFVLIRSQTTSVTVVNNADGGSTVKKDDQETDTGGKPGYKHSESTENYDKPDGGGTNTGGTRHTVLRDDTHQNAIRTIAGQHFQSGGWVEDPPSVVSLVAKSATVSLPDSASRGGYAQGQVLINFTAPDGTTDQSAASAEVTITDPGGKHLTLKTAGEIFLTGLDLWHGKHRTDAGWTVGGGIDLQALTHFYPGGQGRFDVLDTPPGTQPIFHLPWTNPPVVEGGNSLTLPGSGLATGDGPQIIACTHTLCLPVMTQTASDTQLRIWVPDGLPPGPCSLVDENGNGKFSKPVWINPVDVSLNAPNKVRTGQTFAATVKLTGLMPQNFNRTLQASMYLEGPATFATGGTEANVSILHGVGPTKIIAHAVGRISIHVVSVH